MRLFSKKDSDMLILTDFIAFDLNVNSPCLRKQHSSYETDMSIILIVSFWKNTTKNYEITYVYYLL